ncbi:uncharacterized protein TRIADDRAFT_25317 [Trichoplax adhaerens]|uniref:Guanylate cyclase soluble subunit beta-1 n=1 Tax=Trichoplax adhaerens TaxID=10228 RepID=B3RYQ5_TRIAD|nr:hypothetical protein TRIADDRAFT_25317 [Trichoplax adhaerens]EDV24635.1 hypothetical protein TRIADDRAFT_25317 [Trichoplax adhaerens]|eukprot:XP_002112525.1 hypothetical protein TRIADDRAFT_25317 [Trichoplax adhaerens]
MDESFFFQQHGLINHALSLLVKRNFGDEAWDSIREKIGMSNSSYFIQRKVYADDVTFELVKTASEVLGIQVNDLLETFGRFFVSFCEELGYKRILEVMGSNLFEFINNLDSLHDHLATIYSGMKAPSFRCKYNSDNDTITLHYYSTRPNLEYIVVGIIKEVAEKIHLIDINMEVVKTRQNQLDDIQFLIYSKNPAKARIKCHDRLRRSIASSTRKQTKNSETCNFIAPTTFCRAFPFHVLFDRDLSIQQLGHVIERMIPGFYLGDLKMDKIFKIVRPVIQFDFHSILSHINTVFVLTMKPLCPSFLEQYLQWSDVRFKGQMIYLEENEMMLFHCSVSISSLEELRSHGLYLCDIPRYDASRNVILRSDHFRHDYQMMLQLETLNDRLADTYQQLQKEKDLTGELLYSVMPPSVAKQLRLGHKAVPSKHSMASVMFCKVSTFQDITTNIEPTKLIALLNDIYITFDQIIDRQGDEFYKVETLGDKYMVASGIPQYQSTHAKSIVKVAIEMMNTSQKRGNKKLSTMLSIGIHSGEIVAGVIGEKLPRFSIFGDTVNIASRTLTTGVPGVINITEDTFRCLDSPKYFENKYLLSCLGPVNMKGRSTPLTCYIVSHQAKSPASTANGQTNSCPSTIN